MAIQYKTEGKVLIECNKCNTVPIALTWVKGDTKARIHQGGSQGIEVSPSQLRKLRALIDDICNDLVPAQDDIQLES